MRLSFGISTGSCRSVFLIAVANSDLTTCLIRVVGDVTSRVESCALTCANQAMGSAGRRVDTDC